MAFPFLLEAKFAAGQETEFTASGSDSESRLDVLHYETMVRRYNYKNLVPFREAYSAHVTLINDGSPADAYLAEDTAATVGANGDIAVRFYLYVTSNLTMAASDRFTIFAFRAAGQEEAVIDIRNNSGTIEILASETNAGATVRAASLILDEWHCVEMVCNVDAGGGNDGTIAFYLDGYQIGSTITSLNQDTFATCRLGAMNQDAGTTAGEIFFNEFVLDDVRVYPLRDVNSHTVLLTKSGHVALGPGQVAHYALLSGGAADNTLELFDTDQANTLQQQTTIAPQLANVNAGETVHSGNQVYSAYFQRGCYVELAGTNPRAMITLCHANLSPANKRDYALRRPTHGVV